MFTGIVQGMAEVIALDQKADMTSFSVCLQEELSKEIKLGASIAVDGVCLTVVKIDGNVVSFDAMLETLRKTTLKNINEGDLVNVERSARIGDEVGGHLVYGHVTGVADIVDMSTPENNHILAFQIPADSMKYILPKGSIALDGVSLTIVDVNKAEGLFTVYFIPETLRLTKFGQKKEGDQVNFELHAQAQAIVDTVQAVLKEHNIK